MFALEELLRKEHLSEDALKPTPKLDSPNLDDLEPFSTSLGLKLPSIVIFGTTVGSTSAVVHLVITLPEMLDDPAVTSTGSLAELWL